MFTVQIAVVSGKYEHRVVVHSLILEFLDDVSNRSIYLRCHTIQIHDILLIVLWVEPVPPSIPTFTFLIQEWWKLLEVLLRGRFWGWNRHPLVKVFHGRFLGFVTYFASIFGVRGKKGDLEEELFVFRSLPQKLDRICFVDFRDMTSFAVALHVMPSIVKSFLIECHLHVLLGLRGVILSYQASVIATLFHERKQRLVPGIRRVHVLGRWRHFSVNR
mmetsp:Transcript_40065/g.61587  ORF Transcript_40065/g.61587 Transcript_40065/m.61587 type:complete len:217 (-) Transcript_40065:494-1144(-)